ncbi:dipeptide/oligopeptide/nickel ABC transporter permease/ATP-binding protein [Pseudoclavibacter endophyticus]|uniref:Dipeptide/oligopeptide/nickel ABC transporter permease/ATP-binding protein n=2 Tax=Pseudoclavibacter endophyticus TaxID=1778590 RepID=A0A6H9WUR0_9MICO|nr:dipeptide/oligopeptide/nickel ABC transporter permease/ATP-binding protein [Pseudoclavibacter endophyticus]
MFASLRRKPLGVAALAYLACLVVVAMSAPVLATHNPVGADLTAVLQGPSSEHLLGTDALGQDVLSRLLFGARDSLIGVAQALIAWLLVGLPLGIAAGYLGGTADRVIMRFVDIVLAVPSIIVTLAALAIFSNSMPAAMITFGALGAASLARVARSAVLAVREELYIDAARVTGLPTVLIMVRHVLPRTVGIVIIQASLFCAIALGVQTGLAFLGFGPPPPAPTWGGMVAEATTMLQRHPWLLVPSGAAIAVTTMAFGLLGDALRDANAEKHVAAPTPARRRARVAAPVEAPAPTDDELLSVRDLTVAFTSEGVQTTVLDRVGFDVRPGETVGLVGESGSGKSLTSLAVLGLLPSGAEITGGSIRYRGTELPSLGPEEYRRMRGSEIAMISQEPMVALDPSFRIGTQVAEVVRTHDRCSRREGRERAVHLLDQVGLTDPEGVARKFPHEVSGGMAQRVAIAQALAGRPKLLIADEPTTALDVTVQAGILDLLVRLQRAHGMSVLFITHDWGVVADVCERAVVMYAGQVVEQASVIDLFERPQHPYTRALLRSSPHHVAKGEPLPAIGGTVPSPSAWPEGCHFAPRCPLATAACTHGPIAEVTLPGGRTSRCIHVDQLREQPA